MRARLVLVCIAIASATACVAAPEPTPSRLAERKMIHECKESVTTLLGEFSGWAWRLYWQADLQNGPHVQLEYRVSLDPDDGELRRFAGLTDQPGLLVRFDDRFERWDWLRGRPQPRMIEARIGEHAMRVDPGRSVSVNFDSRPTWDLMRNEGDLQLTLFDGSGAVLQSATIVRATLIDMEKEFYLLEGRLAANIADEVNRCPLVPEPLVVVT